MKATKRFLTVGVGLAWLMSGFAVAQAEKPDTIVTAGDSAEVAKLKQALAAAEKRIEELNSELATKSGKEDPALKGLDSDDAGTAREAVKLWAAQGERALPKLRDIAFKGKNAAARSRAKEAIGQITGQWGSQTDLVWKRSVAEAVNPDKPLIVLQLFGSLDEEFC